VTDTDIEPTQPATPPDADVLAMAHELDSQIRQLARHAHVVLDALRALVDEAKATNIHDALGYPSWTAYLADALDGQWKSLADHDKRAEAMQFLAEQGMSQRAIAKVTGTSKTTVQRELEGSRWSSLDHLITGLDGKTYKHADPAAAIMSTLQHLMPRAKFGPKSLQLPDDLTYEEWVNYGKVLNTLAPDYSRR
jgi:hypothetical protein